MGIALNYKKLPKKAFEEIAEGIYILEIDDIIEDKANDGGAKIVMSHRIINSSRKVNYDNYKITNGDGTPNDFGQNKLLTLIDALGFTDLEEITVPLLKTLIDNKPNTQFKAKLVLNEKGFPGINYADIFPLDDAREALNQTEPTIKPELEKPSEVVVAEMDEEEEI